MIIYYKNLKCFYYKGCGFVGDEDLKINKELIKKIVSDIEEDMSNEEIMNLLLERKVSLNTEQNYTMGQKASDKIASFTGSWGFIVTFVLSIIFWIILNSLFLLNAFDAFPYILLNLILSCVAAIQAPLIMMSQKRQEQKDRDRSENDYRVNLKTEIIIEDMHKKLERLQRGQEKIRKYIESVESVKNK